MSHPVEQFLWHVMGYRGIGNLVIGLKPPEASVRAFLTGTVFGTYGDVTVDSRVTLPSVSKIRSMREIDFNTNSPDRKYGLSVPEEKRGNLEWLIDNLHMFRYQTAGEVEEFVRKFASELFPQAVVKRETRGQSFGITVDCQDFYFDVGGTIRPKNVRTLNVAFNAGNEAVAKINGIVGSYYAMRDELLPVELLNAFSSKFIDTSGRIVTNIDLLKQAGSVPNEELLETLRAAKPPAFSPKAAGYVPGALVTHPHFGPGIVTAKAIGNVQVYFPKFSDLKKLTTAD